MAPKAAKKAVKKATKKVVKKATKKTTKKLPPLKSMCFFLMAIAAFFIAFGAAGTLLNAIGIG